MPALRSIYKAGDCLTQGRFAPRLRTFSGLIEGACASRWRADSTVATASMLSPAAHESLLQLRRLGRAGREVAGAQGQPARLSAVPLTAGAGAAGLFLMAVPGGARLAGDQAGCGLCTPSPREVLDEEKQAQGHEWPRHIGAERDAQDAVLRPESHPVDETRRQSRHDEHEHAVADRGAVGIATSRTWSSAAASAATSITG